MKTRLREISIGQTLELDCGCRGLHISSGRVQLQDIDDECPAHERADQGQVRSRNLDELVIPGELLVPRDL
jgi:hypothetical protein